MTDGTTTNSTTVDLPPWVLGDFMAAAPIAMDWLRRRMPRFGGGNRFEQYQRILDSAAAAPGDRWLNSLTHEALQSFGELFLVAQALDDSVDVPQRNLELVLGGAVGDSQNPRSGAWNYQFELLTAALLRLAGLAEIRFDEPDLVIPAGEEELTVAVKRMSTDRTSQVQNRLREAIRQVDARGQRGIVVMATRANTIAPTPSSLAAFASLRDLLRQRVDASPSPHLVGLFLIEFTFYGSGSGMPVQTTAHSNCAFEVHLRGVAEADQTQMMNWILGRGRQLHRSIQAEHAKLRASWWGPL